MSDWRRAAFVESVDPTQYETALTQPLPEISLRSRQSHFDMESGHNPPTSLIHLQTSQHRPAGHDSGIRIPREPPPSTKDTRQPESTAPNEPSMSRHASNLQPEISATLDEADVEFALVAEGAGSEDSEDAATRALLTSHQRAMRPVFASRPVAPLEAPQIYQKSPRRLRSSSRAPRAIGAIAPRIRRNVVSESAPSVTTTAIEGENEQGEDKWQPPRRTRARKARDAQIPFTPRPETRASIVVNSAGRQ